MWITFRCKGKDDLELICSCTAAAIVRPSESKWNGIRERGRKKWMKSNDTRMSCPLEWRPATMSHTPFSFVKNIYRVAQQNGLHGEIFLSFHSTLDYIFIDQIKLGGHRPTLGDDIMSPAPVDHHHHQHKSHRLHKCDGSYTRPERTYNNTPRKVFIQDSYDWVIYIYNQRVYYYWLYDYYRCV